MTMQITNHHHPMAMPMTIDGLFFASPDRDQKSRNVSALVRMEGGLKRLNYATRGAAEGGQRLFTVLVSGKEEPQTPLSSAMDAVNRIFKRISGLPEAEGDDGKAFGAAGVAFCSIHLLVASTQGSLIKSIQESSGASVRVLSSEGVHGATFCYKLGFCNIFYFVLVIIFSNQTKAKISMSHRKLWGHRLKQKRSREKMFQLWAESIARATKMGGCDQQELECDSFEKIKRDIHLQQLELSAQRAREKESTRIQEERAAKEIEEEKKKNLHRRKRKRL